MIVPKNTVIVFKGNTFKEGEELPYDFMIDETAKKETKKYKSKKEGIENE